MLGAVPLLAVTTGLDRPVFTPVVAASLGNAAGFGIGLDEARALKPARGDSTVPRPSFG